MALSPTSSHGGGDVTAPLTLEGTANTTELVVRANAGQGNDITEWQKSDTSVLAAISASGYVLALLPQSVTDSCLVLSLFSAGALADMATWTNPNGTVVYGGIDKSGYHYIGKVAAPADAALGNSQVMLWLDDTPGAASTKLMVKAKDSAGTVRTGTIVLT